MPVLMRKRAAWMWKVKAVLAVIFLIAVFAGYKTWVKPYLTSLQEVKIKYVRDDVTTTTVAEKLRLIDGVPVMEGEENPPLVALMIDNHADARPPAGVSHASVVYEAPAEGGITRFLALFPLTAMPGKVGPVRSVRPYYLKWALEWGSPLFGHVGGSPDGLKLASGASVNDFNEYYKGDYFWRDTGRAAPHNVYTSKTLIEKSGQATSTAFVGWQFETATSTPVKIAPPSYTILFSKPSYIVSWAYNKDTDRYERLQAGVFHRDEDGTKITANNVVIQKVDATVLDAVGRLDVGVQGSGVATFLKHGKTTLGTWKRNVGDARTHYFDDKGKEMLFAPGTTWIEEVTPLNSVDDGSVAS